MGTIQRIDRDEVPAASHARPAGTATWPGGRVPRLRPLNRVQAEYVEMPRMMLKRKQLQRLFWPRAAALPGRLGFAHDRRISQCRRTEGAPASSRARNRHRVLQRPNASLRWRPDPSRELRVASGTAAASGTDDRGMGADRRRRFWRHLLCRDRPGTSYLSLGRCIAASARYR
jgi:hypothetical protein